MAAQLTAGEVRLTGPRKAAIVMMSLDDRTSAALFKALDEQEVEQLAKEIASLGTISPDVSEQVFEEAQILAETSTALTTGGVDNARKMLLRTLGAEQSQRILDRVISSVQSASGFSSLERINPQLLSKFIIGEHPQTVALILAHLNVNAASQLLSLLPDDIRADVLLRMATLGEIAPDVVNRISSFIDQRLKALGGPRRLQRGGVRAVADLCNRLDRGVSRPALEHIESAAPDMAVAIRNLMFVFDDFVNVDDVGIREIVNRADRKALIVALKGASDDVRQRFFQNMSKRAADLLKEEMDVMGAVRLRDVEKAQHEVVNIARKLEEEGVITFNAGAGEPYVV